MRIFKSLLIFFHRFSQRAMMADIMEVCFKNGWRIETIARTKLFSEKFLIRVDDIDDEYKNCFYNGGSDYQPLVISDGKSYKKVVKEAHKRLITPDVI